MQLRFLGKETQEGDSPTLYATDQDSYIVQGWKVDADQSAEMHVEIWTKLFTHLAADGLHGDADTSIYPVVRTTSPQTCIVAGRPVTDKAVREQMRMPEHEDCVEITKAVMKNLLPQERTVAPDHR